MRAKQAQAWQKLQLLQLRRAVYDIAAVNTSQSLMLDRLFDQLTGNHVGKVYDVSCSGPVALTLSDRVTTWDQVILIIRFAMWFPMHGCRL